MPNGSGAKSARRLAVLVEARFRDGTPLAVSRRPARGTIVFAGWQPWDTPERPGAVRRLKGLAETVAQRFAGARPEPRG